MSRRLRDDAYIEEIVDQCKAGDQCDPILKPIEWARLYSLCASVHICTGHYNAERDVDSKRDGNDVWTQFAEDAKVVPTTFSGDYFGNRGVI